MGQESKILYHIVLLFTIFNTELYNLWHLFSVTAIEVVSIHFHFPSFAPRQNAGIGFRNRRWNPRAHLDKGGEESKVGQSKFIAMWKLPENHCESFSHKHKSKEFSFKSVESFKSRWLYLNITTGELISLAEPSFKSGILMLVSHPMKCVEFSRSVPACTCASWESSKCKCPELYQKVARPPQFSATALQCYRWKALMKKHCLICICLRQNCLYLCRSSGTQFPFTCWEVRYCAESRELGSVLPALLQGLHALADSQPAVDCTSEISLLRHS